MKKLIFICTILAVTTSFRYISIIKADKVFMISAAQGNIAEVEVAKLALTQSSSDSVRSFAQMMIDDHTKAQTELAALATAKGVTLPDSTDDMHRMFKQRLMLVSGKTFDSAYLQGQVKDHIQTINLFKAEINNGTDADTKAFASKLLPKLQMHLDHVQKLAQGSVSGMNMQH